MVGGFGLIFHTNSARPRFADDKMFNFTKPLNETV